MKNKFLLMIAAAFLMLAACQPESIKAYLPNEARQITAFAGTWTGTNVIMQDEDAKRKNFPHQTLDVTDLTGFNQIKLTLNMSGSTPSTFTVSPGSGSNVIGLTSGNWTVDNAAKVSQIKLYNGLDTVKLNVDVLSDLAGNKASFTQVKSLDGTPMITYNYKFVR